MSQKDGSKRGLQPHMTRRNLLIAGAAGGVARRGPMRRGEHRTLLAARRDTGGVCDGNNIAATGVPVVDTMGVRGGKIHSPDEFMIAPSLKERAALAAMVLHELATEDVL